MEGGRRIQQRQDCSFKKSFKFIYVFSLRADAPARIERSEKSFVGVSCLLPPHGVRGLNSGPQSCGQHLAPLSHLRGLQGCSWNSGTSELRELFPEDCGQNTEKRWNNKAWHYGDVLR